MKTKYPKEYIVVTIQGLLSGLPFAAVTSTLQVRFITDNASLFIIGCLSLISQIYLYKFIIAPVFDSYKPPLIYSILGKYNGWIFINQIGLIISFISMALISGKTHPLVLITIATLATLFSAVQDVNIDSSRVQILGYKMLVTGSSLYLTAFRFGTLIAGGLAIYLKPHLSWKIIYLAFATVFIIGINNCFIKVNNNNKIIQTNPFNLIKESYKDLKNRPYIISIILFALCYGLGDALTISVNNVFLLKYIKFSMQELALYANFLNLFMLLISTYIARYCFRKYNIFYCILAFGLMQSITILMYLILAYVGSIKPLAIIAILCEGLSGGLVASSIIFIVSFIVKAPFTATQYALFSALAALSAVLLGPIAGLIVGLSSWHLLYLCALICSLPGLFIIYRLKNFFNELNFLSK